MRLAETGQTTGDALKSAEACTSVLLAKARTAAILIADCAEPSCSMHVS